VSLGGIHIILIIIGGAKAAYAAVVIPTYSFVYAYEQALVSLSNR